MKVLKRIRYIIAGKTDTVLDRLENPEEQLSVFVNELNDQVAGLQKAVANAIADEKRLKSQLEDLLARANEWENRAIMALEHSNETLAKEALLKKDGLDEQAVTVQRTWTAQKEATEKLKASLQATKQRVEEAKRKYTLLHAQYKSAETKKRITESLSVRTDASPIEMMERLNDKIRKIEAETEAALDLSGESVGGDLEAQFAEMERKKKGDSALDLLKARLAERGKPASAAGATS